MFFDSTLVLIDPDNTLALEKYCASYFPHLPKVSEPILRQLLWIQNNTVITSQSHTQVNQDSINIEVKRAMTRYACMLMLQEGSEGAWHAFVKNQPESVKLNFETFKILAGMIQSLSEQAQACLLASCFITKTQRAENRVKASMPAGTLLPADSEQFISEIAAHFPDILPICDMLTQEARDLLRFAFYKEAHARHMMDMEGGYNTVSSIRESIQSGEMLPHHMELWFARWILNVAGLDGHVNAEGSVYLTTPVAMCLLALKSELNQLFLDADHPVFDNYLAFRAQQLQVQNNYFAYLGAVMRQYSPDMGKQIEEWFESLPAETRAARLELFADQLRNTRVTPTYKPTVLVNLLSAGCSVAEALTIFSHIESHALLAYRLGIEQGLISPGTPLRFRGVAFSESLLPIIAAFRKNGTCPEIDIDADGNITRRAPAMPSVTEHPEDSVCMASTSSNSQSC